VVITSSACAEGYAPATRLGEADTVILEQTCERFGVSREVRNRALSRSYLEEFKMAIEAGAPADAVGQCLEHALMHDPKNAIALAAHVLLRAGLYRELALAYRNRGALTGARDWLNRLRSQ